jgi:hypothetical protein
VSELSLESVAERLCDTVEDNEEVLMPVDVTEVVELREAAALFVLLTEADDGLEAVAVGVAVTFSGDGVRDFSHDLLLLLVIESCIEGETEAEGDHDTVFVKLLRVNVQGHVREAVNKSAV